MEEGSDTEAFTDVPALPKPVGHPEVLLPGEEFRFEDTVKHWGDYLKVLPRWHVYYIE